MSVYASLSPLPASSPPLPLPLSPPYFSRLLLFPLSLPPCLSSVSPLPRDLLPLSFPPFLPLSLPPSSPRLEWACTLFMSLRACYAVSSTDLAYCAISLRAPVLTFLIRATPQRNQMH
eukprot:67425-Rhodomonas_salina.1